MAGFACVYYGNTGSSWLLDVLGRSPDVLVPGFEPVETWAWDTSVSERLRWIRTTFDPPEVREGPEWERWKEAVDRSPNAKPNAWNLSFRITGFKMSNLAVEHPWRTLLALRRSGAKTIVLTRRNRLKHALSLYRYREEKKSQFELKGVRPPTELDLDVYDDWLQKSAWMHEQSRAFRRSAERVLGHENVADVEYEEFVTEQGKQEVVDRMVSFLGVEAPQLDSHFEKATPDSLEAAVSNFEALRGRYADTEYRQFFDED